MRKSSSKVAPPGKIPSTAEFEAELLSTENQMLDAMEHEVRTEQAQELEAELFGSAKLKVRNRAHH